jgi:peptidoglycan DL-endopeptidase CwlO
MQILRKVVVTLPRRMRRFILLPILLAAALVAAPPSPADRLDEVTRELDEARQRADQEGRQAGVLVSEIGALNDRMRSLEAELVGLRARTAAADRELGVALDELAERQQDLRLERARLARLKSELASGRQILADRLVDLYKADSPDLLTVVLNTDGFAQLLEVTEGIRRVGAQDERVLNRVTAAKAEAVRSEARLDRLEAEQRDLAGGLEAQRDRAKRAEDAVAVAQADLASVRDRREGQLAATRESRREQLDDVDRLESVQAKIERRLAPDAVGSSVPAGPIRQGSGGWVWPVDGIITSPFCEVRSWEACHPGLDIAAPMGTPVRAAASGTVVLMQSEASSGGYGNFTCVQHDAATSSCYAHQSSFAASSGASVSAGEVIGYVGSTGFSTGPHLHFEVRVNGAVTSPLNYL